MQSVEAQSYGRTLPDQVDRIATFFDAHLEMISDVRDIYREQVALQKEYASKLQVLVRKAADKKNKMEASFVLGNEPTKAWDASTLKRNSLNMAYDEFINSILRSAQDHINVADAINTQVVEVLKVVERKSEDAKKKELQFFQKLLADRDRIYAERIKNKQKYDDDCMEVETYRQKQGRAQDEKHADRVAKQAEQQRNDMLNSKNVYLISTAVANRTKAQFYDENLPTLEDQFQSLQRRLVERFAKILMHSQALQMGHLDTLKSRVHSVENALGSINVANDQNLFIDHNMRAFTAPSDWAFEPCATHYDTSEMNTEPAPKIFLQNKLIRSRSKLDELVPLVEAKAREVDQISRVLASYEPDHLVGNIDEMSDNFLDAKHQLMLYVTSERILGAEIDTIVEAVGDDEGGQQPHSFKSSSFSIPTQCGYCKTSIWGLSKQGKTCKLCGLSVHSKCELKVPADCQKSEGTRHSSLPRQGKPASYATTNAPSASSFVHSSPPEEQHEDSYPMARVLFDFTPSSEFELAITEGNNVRVVEPDDGSGWVKVADLRGNSGLVPASYIELDGVRSLDKPPVSKGGSGRYVRAIYSYQAAGDDELSLRDGELIELTSGPSGGKNYGDGWWEGLNTKGKKGIFPSNYVEVV